MNAIKAMLAQKKEMTPKTGFNLVGVDDYEKPGEQLFIISSHKTESEAKSAQTKYAKKEPEVQTFIYSAQGKTEGDDSLKAQMTNLLSGLE